MLKDVALVDEVIGGDIKCGGDEIVSLDVAIRADINTIGIH